MKTDHTIKETDSTAAVDNSKEEQKDENNCKNKNIGKDRGWAWVCMLGSCLTHIIIGGIERTAGILFIHYRAMYPESSAFSVAWVFSLYTCIRQAGAGVVGLLLHRFSMRSLVIAGGILHFAGIMMAAYPQPTLAYMHVSMGVVTGIGGCLSYTPGLTVVGLYFTKYRGLATGIATSGMGIGAFALTPLVTWLLGEYGYHGGMLIFAAITLHMCFSGALFRPVALHQRLHSPRHTTVQVELLPLQERDERSLNNGQYLEPLDSASGSGVCEKILLSPNETDHLPRANNDCEGIEITCIKLKSGETIQQKLIGSSCIGGTTHWMKKLAVNLGLTLLYDYPFCTCVLAIILFSIGFQSGLVFLPMLAKSRGLSSWQQSIILALMGVFDCLSRIISGGITDTACVRPVRPYFYNVALFCLAAITIACNYARTFGQFLAVSMFYGYFSGMFVSLKSVVIVDYLGVDKLVYSFGILVTFQSIGTLIGPPISGLLCDVYGRYDEAFYFSAACIFAGGLTLMTGNIVYYRRRASTCL